MLACLAGQRLFVALRVNVRFGVVVVGWGSCCQDSSGCVDAPMFVKWLFG